MRSLVRGAATLALACSLAVSGSAFAQTHPNKPIRSIVPFIAGASYDTIMRIAMLDNVVVTHPSVAAKNLKALIALLKANPGKYSYGSGGVSGSSHLAAALFTNLAGVNMLHVPYKGGGFAVTGLPESR